MERHSNGSATLKQAYLYAGRGDDDDPSLDQLQRAVMDLVAIRRQAYASTWRHISAAVMVNTLSTGITDTMDVITKLTKHMESLNTMLEFQHTNYHCEARQSSADEEVYECKAPPPPQP